MQHAKSELQTIYSSVLQNASPDEAAMLAWRLISGSIVASRTRVLGLRNGVLRVEVHERAWRAELAQLAAEYVGAMNRMVARQVDRIEFVLPGEARSASSKGN